MENIQTARSADQMAKEGLGVFLSIVDQNGHAAFFFPFDQTFDDIEIAESVSSMMFLQVSIWLAENGYLPASDRKGVIIGAAS